MEFIEVFHLTGLVIGTGTFFIIGIFHPLVIKGEYYFGVKCWWVFLFFSIGGIILSLTVRNVILSSLCGVFAFSALWGINELFCQRKRVEKGWFPKREKKSRTEKNKN
ncbi:MAG: DUF4491 family protein [Tannerella sp.]|jgi:hypothetical protein|nr:DUF4491 family protein [Tannerella sp.]